jgi:hypothetical protein
MLLRARRDGTLGDRVSRTRRRPDGQRRDRRPGRALVRRLARTPADVRREATRPDEAIRRDVVDGVLRRTLWIDPGQVHVHVDTGVVTLTGAVGRRTTAGIAARLAAAVPGVVAVVDQVRHDFDDTTLARSRVGRSHPFSAAPFNP